MDSRMADPTSSERRIQKGFRPGRIISGGQTGVDRGALEAAIALGIPHGGWCPLGRSAEDGVIPARYQLQETDSPQYAVRTEWNVRDADGTLILSWGFDPVWWGVINVVIIELGMLIPPLGMNVFVVKGIAPSIPLAAIYRGVAPYVASNLVRLTLLLTFPALCLWLPALLKG